MGAEWSQASLALYSVDLILEIQGNGKKKKVGGLINCWTFFFLFVFTFIFYQEQLCYSKLCWQPLPDKFLVESICLLSHTPPWHYYPPPPPFSVLSDNFLFH